MELSSFGRIQSAGLVQRFQILFCISVVDYLIDVRRLTFLLFSKDQPAILQARWERVESAGLRPAELGGLVRM